MKSKKNKSLNVISQSWNNDIFLNSKTKMKKNNSIVIDRLNVTQESSNESKKWSSRNENSWLIKSTTTWHSLLRPIFVKPENLNFLKRVQSHSFLSTITKAENKFLEMRSTQKEKFMCRTLISEIHFDLNLNLIRSEWKANPYSKLCVNMKFLQWDEPRFI